MVLHKNEDVPDSKHTSELQNDPLNFVQEDSPFIMKIMLNALVHFVDKCVVFGC
jgi:hypothetical protein